MCKYMRVLYCTVRMYMKKNDLIYKFMLVCNVVRAHLLHISYNRTYILHTLTYEQYLLELTRIMQMCCNTREQVRADVVALLRETYLNISKIVFTIHHENIKT
jgi:hypothetical protein